MLGVSFKLAAPAVPELSGMADSADLLTEHAVAMRYPDEWPRSRGDESEEAITVGKTIRGSLLPRDGRDPSDDRAKNRQSQLYGSRLSCLAGHYDHRVPLVFVNSAMWISPRWITVLRQRERRRFASQRGDSSLQPLICSRTTIDTLLSSLIGGIRTTCNGSASIGSGKKVFTGR